MHPPGELPGETSREQRNVLRAFAQRGNANRENIQTVIQIAAKLFSVDHLLQVAMGRGHYSDVNFLRPGTAQALEFPLLQDAQEFRLQIEGDIADFVQKQRTLIGQLDPAGSSA